jgi:hypothetical protein
MNVQPQFESFFEQDVAVVQVAQVNANPPATNERNNIDGLISTSLPVRVEVHKAYSKGGTPLNIQAIANVKISSDPLVVGNAIERFLDHDRSEVVRVAQETRRTRRGRQNSRSNRNLREGK